MPITPTQKILDAERSREMSRKSNARAIKIARITNGYKVVELATGDEYSYPGVGMPLEKFDNGSTNVIEHLLDFFKCVEEGENE